MNATSRQRLEVALSECIRNARVRQQIRRIYETEIPNACVFWDVEERQVELVTDDWEIIIQERDGHLPIPSRMTDMNANDCNHDAPAGFAAALRKEGV